MKGWRPVKCVRSGVGRVVVRGVGGVMRRGGNRGGDKVVVSEKEENAADLSVDIIMDSVGSTEE